MLKDRFNNLSQREQHTLLIAIPVVVILVLWLAVFRPLLDSRSQLQDRITRQQTDIAWMKEAATKIRPSVSGQQPINSGSIRQRVTQALGQYGVTLSRIEQGNDDSVNVWAERASFNQLLSAMQQAVREGLRIEKAQINQTTEPGIVSARLTFVGGSQ